MLYFGYGSNLDDDDLSRYCREREVGSVGLEKVGVAYLPDRRLAFTHRSTSRGGGVLDVPPALGSAVSGVLFRLASPEGWGVLDGKEAEGHLYVRCDTIALTDDGAEHAARTYEVASSRRESYVAPAPSYL